MKILLIWDIDGTLINCKGVGRRALNATFEQIYGIQDGFAPISMAGRLDRRIISDAMEYHQVKVHDMDRFYKTYGQALLDEMHRLKPYVHEGVLDVLQETERSGEVLNTVGTGNCKVGADMKLEFTGLTGYMKLGGYGSDHELRAELIKDVIDQSRTMLGKTFEKESIFVVGDTPRDIQAGKDNGVKTIALLTGGYTREDLEQYAPDSVLSSLENKDAFYRAIRMI